MFLNVWKLTIVNHTSAGGVHAAALEIGSDFLRSLDWSSSLCSEIIPTCVRRARQTCAICPLMIVLRHLNQGRDGGLHSNSSCFWSIELLFPQPCRWYCKCDHRSDPPNSPARNPPPAVIRQKGSACSVTRLLVIIVTSPSCSGQRCCACRCRLWQVKPTWYWKHRLYSTWLVAWQGIMPIPRLSTSIIIDSAAMRRQLTISLWFSIVNPNLWGGIVTALLQLDRQSRYVTAVDYSYKQWDIHKEE